MSLPTFSDYGSRRAEQTATRRAEVRSGEWITLEAVEAVRKPASDSWSSLAADWYNAWAADPVGRHFTSADWAQAFLIAEVIDRADKIGTLHRGSTVETILMAMRSLGAGPVERQRAKIRLVEAQNETVRDIQREAIEAAERDLMEDD